MNMYFNSNCIKMEGAFWMDKTVVPYTHPGMHCTIKTVNPYHFYLWRSHKVYRLKDRPFCCCPEKILFRVLLAPYTL